MNKSKIIYYGFYGQVFIVNDSFEGIPTSTYKQLLYDELDVFENVEFITTYQGLSKFITALRNL